MWQLIMIGGSAAATLLAYMKGQYDAYVDPPVNVGGLLTPPNNAPANSGFSAFNLFLFAIIGAVGVGLLREVRFLWGK